MPTAALSSVAVSLLRAALCSMFCLLVVSARSAAGYDDDVILRLAGDEILCTTIITPFARNHLERKGAVGIQVEDATAPWTFRISGRAPDGKEISILVRSSSTEDGLKRLADDDVDIALASRQATSQEIRVLPILAKTDDPAAFASVARAAIVIVVNPSNPVTTLTFEQLHEIYAGTLTNWADLGGPAGEIHPLAIQAGSTTRELFQSVVMGAPPPDGTVRSVATFEELRATVLSEPGAIGYLVVPGSLKRLNIEVGKNRIVSPPNNYQLMSGDYALTQTLYLYRNPEIDNPEVTAFFRAAVSVPAQFSILSAGLSYLGPQLILPEFPPTAPAAYAELADRGLRVSTTIRFADGSTTIDAAASNDLDSLARYLRNLRVRGEQIALAAFSDDSGSPARDYAISEQLGKTVASELKRRLVTPGNVIAVGSALPLSNNFTPAGRAINRRVEIWLRPSSDDQQ